MARINGYNPIGICYNVEPFASNKGSRRKYSYTPFYRGILGKDNDEPDCDTDDSGMLKYLNDPEIQQQLNVRPTKWLPCRD